MWKDIPVKSSWCNNIQYWILISSLHMFALMINVIREMHSAILSMNKRNYLSFTYNQMPIRVNMPALMRLFFGRHSWLPLMTGHPFWEATFDQHLGWLLVRGFTVYPFHLNRSTVCYSVNSRDQIADPTRFLPSGVLEWSPSDRSMFALIFPRERQRMTEGTPNARSFQLHQYLSTNPIQISHLHGCL